LADFFSFSPDADLLRHGYGLQKRVRAEAISKLAVKIKISLDNNGMTINRMNRHFPTAGRIVEIFE